MPTKLVRLRTAINSAFKFALGEKDVRPPDPRLIKR